MKLKWEREREFGGDLITLDDYGSVEWRIRTHGDVNLYHGDHVLGHLIDTFLDVEDAKAVAQFVEDKAI